MTASQEGSLICRPDSYVDRLDLGNLFACDQPLEVELGSGDGGFLCAWAGRYPGRNFIGVERLLGRMRKLDRRGGRANLTNLRLVRIEAFYFLQYLIPPGSVAVLHVYFPDPWPKRRHHKNRLINAEFVQAAASAMTAEGRVFVRTDSVEYFRQMGEVFAASAQFEPGETPEELRAIPTDFERDFQAQGLATLHAAWCRI